MFGAAVDVTVAPHVGAWIETSIFQNNLRKNYVAPHVGAWIETSVKKSKVVSCLVAPHVGGGNETKSFMFTPSYSVSLPTWERGLKLLLVVVLGNGVRRSPRGSVD